MNHKLCILFFYCLVRSSIQYLYISLLAGMYKELISHVAFTYVIFGNICFQIILPSFIETAYILKILSSHEKHVGIEQRCSKACFRRDRF